MTADIASTSADRRAERIALADSNVLHTEQLSKHYGSFIALDQVDLQVPRAQVLGLLGPNGAGKSTLLRLLVGATQPTSGRATLFSLDSWRDRDRVHERVAYLPGDARLPKRMRGREVLEFFTGLRGVDVRIGFRIAQTLELDLKRRVGAMSTGMRQKLAIAVVFASGCELLILDEPTANLDPTIRSAVIDLVRTAQRQGSTVLFSSHVLPEIEEGCDRVVIVKRGQLVFDSPVKDIIEQHRIEARVGSGQDERVPHSGPTVQLPPSLQAVSSLEWQRDGKVCIVTRELDPLLGWMAGQHWTDVRIDRVGLNQLYHQWHPYEGSSESVFHRAEPSQ